MALPISTFQGVPKCLTENWRDLYVTNPELYRSHSRIRYFSGIILSWSLVGLEVHLKLYYIRIKNTLLQIVIVGQLCPSTQRSVSWPQRKGENSLIKNIIYFKWLLELEINKNNQHCKKRKDFVSLKNNIYFSLSICYLLHPVTISHHFDLYIDTLLFINSIFTSPLTLFPDCNVCWGSVGNLLIYVLHFSNMFLPCTITSGVLTFWHLKCYT